MCGKGGYSCDLCNSCGKFDLLKERMRDKMKCIHCGKMIERGKTRCPECGGALPLVPSMPKAPGDR